MNASLDIHANNVSPASKTDSLETSYNRLTGKKHRHNMRKTAGKLMHHERVHDCGCNVVGSVGTLHQSEGRAHFGGVETCGSVWMCPVCAAKITEGRKEDINAVLSAHQAEGGKAYMATLTIPHHRFQSCADLKTAVANTWRKVKSGKKWILARDRHNWIGDIRALEVTYGKNGWHPHLHILILFEPRTSIQRMENFGEWLFDTWRHNIEKLGYGTCKRAAYTFDQASEISGAADYVGKWGAALELTKAHIKSARNGGRTPWQILSDYMREGSERDKKLFQEYAYSFKGARQLTWGRAFTRIDGKKEPSIRARYLQESEKTDLELATEEQIAQTHKLSFGRRLFQTISNRSLTADLLIQYEKNGLNGVERLLNQHSIPLTIRECPGLEKESFVPFLDLPEMYFSYLRGLPETMEKYPKPRKAPEISGLMPEKTGIFRSNTEIHQIIKS